MINFQEIPYVAHMIVSTSFLLTVILRKNKRLFLVLVALLDRHARSQWDASGHSSSEGRGHIKYT